MKKTESNEVRCEGEKRKQDRSERNNEYREEERKKETERQREREKERETHVEQYKLLARSCLRKHYPQPLRFVPLIVVGLQTVAGYHVARRSLSFSFPILNFRISGSKHLLIIYFRYISCRYLFLLQFCISLVHRKIVKLFAIRHTLFLDVSGKFQSVFVSLRARSQFRSSFSPQCE